MVVWQIRLKETDNERQGAVVSLDWSSEKCPKGASAETDEENRQRDLLVFFSMNVSLGQITSKNRDEWFVRFRMLKAIDRCMLLWEDEQLLEALDRWEGLSTNVSTMTRDAWWRKVSGDVGLQAAQLARRKLERVGQDV